MATPTAVELLWGLQQRPRRGPKPALSLDAIVAEAIALADTEGLASLSMQRLAVRLGFTKMSLYRYVPGKAELTSLMLDRALGPVPDLFDVAAQPRWRTGLRRWAETIFERYLAHPWSIELTTGAHPIGPNELGWMDAALRATADTGLTGAERLDSIVLLTGHARSLVQQVSSVADGAASEQLATSLAETMTIVGDRYPAVRAAFAEEAAANAANGRRDDALNFGIARILDGLAVLIDSREGLGS
ncbi:TetR/AcrR family transcriptional regulator [Nocardia callitridis]|uniref:TetR/AcrR family transcriptional regulator n=1 Tax=Nocardia callitridis TaxID=648753 RepID=A0ABP9JRN1_9NOCA